MDNYNKIGGDLDISDIEKLFHERDLNNAIQNFEPGTVDKEEAEKKTAKLVEQSTRKGKKNKKSFREILKENRKKIVAGGLATVLIISFALGFLHEKLKYRKPAIDIGDQMMTQMMLECGAITEDEKGNLTIEDLNKLRDLGLDDSTDLFFAIRIAEKAKGHQDIMYEDEISQNISNPENNYRPYTSYTDALNQMGYRDTETEKPSDLVFNNMHFGKLEELYKELGEDGYREFLEGTLGQTEVKGGTHK